MDAMCPDPTDSYTCDTYRQWVVSFATLLSCGDDCDTVTTPLGFR
jgi:hypothetical protein